MVNMYVGITDYDWFQFLAALPEVDEVNFWQPGGRTNFQALRPGELFLFKLHAPRNFIVGGGSSHGRISCRPRWLGKLSARATGHRRWLRCEGGLPFIGVYRMTRDRIIRSDAGC
jgi:hypothetical protein